MQLRSVATYASMSSQNASNNQDVVTISLEEISATHQSHQDAIIQLISKLDEIMKLLISKRPLKMRRQAINSNTHQVNRAKSGIIL